MSTEPPPWAQPVAAPQPLSRRRVTLLIVAGLLVVALVVAIVALRSALDAVVAVADPSSTGEVSVALDDCGDSEPELIDQLLEIESPDLVQMYGTGPVTPSEYRHPDGFPTVAVTWAEIIPTCGTTFVIPGDVGVAYYLDATESSRSQFEAFSSMLTALGYVLRTDDSERELLDPAATVDSEPSPSDIEDTAEGEASASAYRSFRYPSGSRLWVQFDPFDVDDPDGEGFLYLVYYPR